MTIEKLRYLLGKATVVFGDRMIGELTSQEIAEWRMRLSPGYRFEATQALRQVLQRAVAWGMLDVNPAKVGVDNPVPTAEGAASVRVVDGTRSHRVGHRAAVRADDPVRGGHRVAAGGMDRT